MRIPLDQKNRKRERLQEVACATDCAATIAVDYAGVENRSVGGEMAQQQARLLDPFHLHGDKPRIS